MEAKTKKPKKRPKFAVIARQPGQTDAEFKRAQEEFAARLTGESTGESEATPEDMAEMKKAFDELEAEEAADGKKLPSFVKRLLKSFWE